MHFFREAPRARLLRIVVSGLLHQVGVNPNPVTTIQLFLLQILHGNTAYRHVPHRPIIRGALCCQAALRPYGVPPITRGEVGPGLPPAGSSVIPTLW